jgi:rubrerythrin
MTPGDHSDAVSGVQGGPRANDPLSEPGAPLGDPLFSEPADEARTIGDEGLLEILEAAIADERAAQATYRRGYDRCVDAEACGLFAKLLADEEAHERGLLARYVEVKKRPGLSGSGRRDA